MIVGGHGRYVSLVSISIYIYIYTGTTLASSTYRSYLPRLVLLWT